VMFLAWNSLNLDGLVPESILYAFGKTNLGVLRLLHFLALAIVADWLIPWDWPPLSWRVMQPLILCGQHSLEVFCLGVTLAFVGQVAVVGPPGSFMTRFVVGVFGIAAMVGVSALLSWYSSTRVSFRVVAHAAEEKAGIVEPPAVGSAMQRAGSGPA
jgi:hypothetical protein